jgi:hypothetical protein
LRKGLILLGVTVAVGVVALYWRARTEPHPPALSQGLTHPSNRMLGALPARRPAENTAAATTPYPIVATDVRDRTRDAGVRTARAGLIQKSGASNRFKTVLPQGWSFSERFVAFKNGLPSEQQLTQVAGYQIALRENTAAATTAALPVVTNSDRQQIGVVTGYVFAKLAPGADAAEIADANGWELAKEYKSLSRAVFATTSNEQLFTKTQSLQKDSRVQSVRMEIQFTRAEAQ